MKKVVSIIALVIMTSTIAFAQSNKEEIDFYQSIFGMGKKAMVADFLELEKSDAFWTIYDQYEIQRKELGKERLAVLNDYANNYLSLTDEKTDKIIKKATMLKKNLDKLIVKNHKKIKKASGSKVAAQFYQLENYFLAVIRSEILSKMPFIGEFK